MNKLIRYKPAEKTLRCQAQLMLIGLGHIIDGVVVILSLGFLSSGCALNTARMLAIARMNSGKY